MVWVDYADGNAGEDSGALAAFRGDKGPLTEDLVEVYPLSHLKKRFEKWDGGLDWMDAAYTKFKSPDPRSLKEKMKDLEGEERQQKMQDPVGATKIAPPQRSSEVGALLAQAQQNQAATEQLAQALQKKKDSDSSDSDSELEQTSPGESPMKGKALFDVPAPILTEKRPRRQARHKTPQSLDKAANKKSPPKQRSSKRPKAAPLPASKPVSSTSDARLAKDLQLAKESNLRKDREAREMHKKMEELNVRLAEIQKENSTREEVKDLEHQNQRLTDVLESTRTIAIEMSKDPAIVRAILGTLLSNVLPNHE